HQYFLAHYGESLDTIRPAGPQSWSNVGPMALWSYALGRQTDARAAMFIRDRSRAAADAIVERAARSGYRTTMTAADYVWGSNGVAANYGVQLLIANALHPDPRYVATAIENLHYLLGRNAFSLSWLTQVGAHPFRHPHHRPSAADAKDEPWPGLLSGGPNARRQDPVMAKLPDLPPARMYLDEQASYATNEIAINWNAALVSLLAGVLTARRRVADRIASVDEWCGDAVRVEHGFNRRRVQRAPPPPRTCKRRGGCDPDAPVLDRQLLGVGAAVERIPAVAHAIRKERISPLESFPRLRILPRLEDDAHVVIRTIYACLAL